MSGLKKSKTTTVLLDQPQDIPSHISIDPFGVYLSPEILLYVLLFECFVEIVYPAMLGENFQIYSAEITENAFVS